MNMNNIVSFQKPHLAKNMQRIVDAACSEAVNFATAFFFQHFKERVFGSVQNKLINLLSGCIVLRQRIEDQFFRAACSQTVYYL